LNKDFFVGYSPERINPGDKINSLASIVKVTSGSNEVASEFIDSLYMKIISVGTFKASSIKVAEASKAIENAQRDLNISFVNELAIIFDRFNIDTTEVLEAASTKWNFLNFKPGLVGGHCISVDPYYLTYKSEMHGYKPQVILSGRKVNDEIPEFIASKCVKLMIKKGHNILNSKALILGATFKENCPDIRNSKIPDVYKNLSEFGFKIDIYDPLVDKNEFKNENGIEMTEDIFNKKFDLIIFCVSHSIFSEIDIIKLKRLDNSIIFDVKSFLPKELVDSRL
jgi:UDP-N-acetyl-D-galactosamine dehydrogenase